MSKRANEKTLMKRIRAALNDVMSGVRLWRNNIGVDVTRGVRYGLAIGSGDLIGVVVLPSGIGRFLSLEVKRPECRNEVGDDQRRWQEIVRGLGGIAEVVTSIEEAEAAVALARSDS
jgi:hypothetical protein